MITEPQWDFAPTGGAPDDGIHNSMIEHFAGNYNYHLAREVIQNSLDAKSERVVGPVEVKFKLEIFTPKEFPGYDSFTDVLNKCKDYWLDDETHEFVQEAQECISLGKIPMLKISDYKTKGLSGGDFQKDGTWYKLVKSKGSSSKTKGEGGSFGLGKGAPFASSFLRTVFYSTKNEQGFSIFQGIAELVSHSDNSGESKRGSGSLGEGQYALRSPEKFPSERFWRKSFGTDIYVAGYRNNIGWEDDLIKSILRNFWYPIFRNELVVEVENHLLNTDSVESYLTTYFGQEEYRDDVEPIGNPLLYYMAKNRGHYFPAVLPELGEVSFYFLETDEYLNHVAMMRKSHMIICSRGFRFPGNYAGVFICDDDDGNQKLRKMEPPAHDKWEVGRYPDKGKKIHDELTHFIRKCLSESKAAKKNEMLEIPEMHKYLPDNEDWDEGNGKGEEDYTGEQGVDESSQVIQKKEAFPIPVSISPYKVSIINRKVGEQKASKTNEGTGGKKQKRVPKNNDGEAIKTRVFISKSQKTKSEFEYSVIAQVNKTANYDIKFYSIGDDDLKEKLQLIKTSSINGQKHHINVNTIKKVPLQKDQKVTFTITVKSKFKNAIKLQLNELQ